MRKIIVICVLLTAASCSVFKHQSSDVINSEVDGKQVNSIERIRNFNISNQSYYIAKAEIQLISEERKENFIGSIKFSFPDKYLISLRTKSGIEAARILFTGDTILINDRINRILYYGKPDYISKKLGISSTALPLIFGDMIFKKFDDSNSFNCAEQVMTINSAMKGKRYESKVDCKKYKMVSCIQKNDENSEQVRMTYSRFLSIGEYLFPSIIGIDYEKVKVFIRIKKIDIPWGGNFEFIPGIKYDIIPLK